MTSKAARRRAKKRRTGAKADLAGMMTKQRPQTARQEPGQAGRGQAVRPTQERMAKGKWAEPSGAAKSQQPIVDLASDMIGQLHCDRQISDAQEQAARSYQEIHARYMDELPEIGGFKSCLAGGSGGYDASDGNPAVVAEYRSVCRKAGMLGERELFNVCVMGERPRNILILRQALSDISG